MQSAVMQQCLCKAGVRQSALRRSSARKTQRQLTAPLRVAAVEAPPAAAAATATAAAPPTPAPSATRLQLIDGRFVDDRWDSQKGTWIMDKFKGADGEVNWDAVIDCEMERRRLLENSPIPSTNEEPVNFDTSEIPWFVWVRRFHLPEAEKLNGRAAMVGYFMAAIVDLLTGAGLVEQQESFLGKLVLHITVFGILLIRTSSDVNKYKNLLDEATFYDKQWNATWEGKVRPSETEKTM